MRDYRRFNWQDAALWSVAVALAAFAVCEFELSFRQPIAVARVTDRPSTNRAFVMDAARVDVEAALLVKKDPFRSARKPPLLRFLANGLTGDATPERALPPKPRLSLGGIVGGPPWEAILDGLPGSDPTVLVRQGQRVGELVVRSIGRTTIVVAGFDTVWHLELRKQWQ